MKGILTAMALIAVLFVSVQYAEAELLSIEGTNSEAGIILYLEDEIYPVVQWTTHEGDSTHFDLKLKEYKTGAFTLRDKYMRVSFHPLGDSQYKIFVLTHDGVYRMIGNSFELNPIQEIQVPQNTTRIEPKSSVGADITKHDIPTTGRDQIRESKIILYLDRVDQIMINDEYTPTIKVENQDYQKISADVTLEISRDGYIIRSISDNIQNGVWMPVINILDDYYTPGFCYGITVTATSGNHTDIVQEDFTVYSTAKYWDKKSNPIDSDSHCND